MTTKERLAQTLEQAQAPKALITAARAGCYDDFESESATPISDLVRDLQEAKLMSLAQRAMDGEFDSTKEEAATWFEQEGKHLLLKP